MTIKERALKETLRKYKVSKVNQVPGEKIHQFELDWMNRCTELEAKP